MTEQVFCFTEVMYNLSVSCDSAPQLNRIAWDLTEQIDYLC